MQLAIARPRAAAWIAAASLLALATSGCIAPVVLRSDASEPPPGAYRKVAIVPFHPWPVAARAGQGVGGPPADAPPIVASFVAAALEDRGVDVVLPEVVAAALGMEVEPLGDLDPAELARFVHARFGASAMLIGVVHRYRNRTVVGSRPSVSFDVTSYLAPEGTKLSTIHFDETQVGITERPSNLVRLPGGGTRWLTPVELSQWGADATAAALLAPPEPSEDAAKGDDAPADDPPQDQAP